LVKVLLGRDEHPQFDMGDINLTPVPELQPGELSTLKEPAVDSFRIRQRLDSANEASHVFLIPALMQVRGDTLGELITAWQTHLTNAHTQLAQNQLSLDDAAFGLYGVGDEDRRAIKASSARQSSSAPDTDQPEGHDEPDTPGPSGGRRQLTADVVSYAVGCLFGRWDVRLATGERTAAELPDPFAPLPVCAPGALTGEDGLPLAEAPQGYPLRVDTDGILVDDPTHADDVVACVSKVIELLWPHAAGALEREAFELLSVKDLRDYFRRLTVGGFWPDHITQYSMSRRKAPIYWLLRSSKGNYALWLYYHRLDKDVLYKALVNYVEPKLRLEDNNLIQLRRQRERVGTTGQEAKQIEKQLERQESFLSELHDFHDKLKSAADLHLEPDLNDGVVLNIAPLRELVPWKEAEKYWKELREGKYEWSTVSKQLRAKGLIKP
jgi:hypothetical protein